MISSREEGSGTNACSFYPDVEVQGTESGGKVTARRVRFEK